MSVDEIRIADLVLRDAQSQHPLIDVRLEAVSPAGGEIRCMLLFVQRHRFRGQ